MANDPFRGPILKLDRAYHHLVNLRNEEAAFFKGNPPALVIEIDPQTGDKIAKVRLAVEPPEIIHVLVAEVIYHLRSSLDQLAVVLARLSVEKPNVKNIYFPTGDSLKGFIASRKGNTRGVDCDFVKMMIRLKPYDGGNSALRSIFRLANIDKHLELIPAAASGNVVGMSHFKISHANVGLIIGGMHSLYEGVPLSNLGKAGTIEPMNANAQIQVAGQITFGNVSIFEGIPIAAKLSELLDLTHRITQSFIAYCRKTGRIP